MTKLPETDKTDGQACGRYRDDAKLWMSEQSIYIPGSFWINFGERP